MEAMAAESEGKFTYCQIYGYIKDGKYPEVLEKCELVGKGHSFSRCMQEMHLYYTGGMFYVNVRLAINPLLAKFLLIGRGPHIYHRYGDGSPHIYVVLGTGSPILYSYGDPIHIGRGPHIYLRYGDGGPHIYVDLGTGSPNLYSLGGPGVPKIGDPHIHMTPVLRNYAVHTQSRIGCTETHKAS